MLVWLYVEQNYKCLFRFLFRNQKPSNNLLLSRSKNQIFLGFNIFILLVTHWKITLSERLFYFRKLFAKAVPHVHFFFVARQVYFYFTAHTSFKTNWFTSRFLYLCKCVHARLYMLTKDSHQSENYSFYCFASKYNIQ